MNIICRQGQGHYMEGLNNQDFYYAENNIKVITDGCSESKFSEVGTRLFCQYFSLLETRFDYTKLEENVEKVFSKIIAVLSDTCDSSINTFIENNMLFTIIACFELEDCFIVKYIGDGYIVAINANDMVSYIRLNYGKMPPYFAYNKIKTEKYKNKIEFKTLEFLKEDFKNIGVASDGLEPIAQKKIGDDIEPIILGHSSKYSIAGIVSANEKCFYDDVTFVI